MTAKSKMPKPGEWVRHEGRNWLVVYHHNAGREADIVCFDKSGNVDHDSIINEGEKWSRLDRAPWKRFNLGMPWSYRMWGLVSSDGRRQLINAGCRYFAHFNEAEQHWENRDRANCWDDDAAINASILKVVEAFRRKVAKVRAAA